MTTESSETTGKNTQATASLVLGVTSIILALFNFVPGLLSAIGFVGVVAALLAFLAGARGLRAARNFEGQGRNMAFAGLASGGLGFLLFIITFIIPIGEGVSEMQALLTPQLPQTFQGDGFTLTYPGDWAELPDVFTEQQICNQSGVNCYLAIAHPSQDGTNINLMGFALNMEATIEEVDQEVWNQAVSENASLDLESRDLLEVGGLPAVKRVFSNPSPASSGQPKVMQVYILNGLTLYMFTGWTPDTDTFSQHRPEMEEILNSLQFSTAE